MPATARRWVDAIVAFLGGSPGVLTARQLQVVALVAEGASNLAHLVHVHKRVEGGQADVGEGGAHGEAL